MTDAIELRGVVKRYGEFEAVRGIDLRIPSGSTYGLLGPNGAGKTTSIRMILTILEPTAGEIRVLGRPVDRRVLDRVGYLPEERGVYKKMTVRRLLAFLAELKGVPTRESARRIDRWLERMDLSAWRESRLEELSKGMQQKIQFISTVLHEPEVVILDEPFSGLDPINQRVLREIIADLKRDGRTILFSTHIIEHAERMCDHVCIIGRGRKLVDGTVSQVKAEHGERYITLATTDGAAASAALSASALVSWVRDRSAAGDGEQGVHAVMLRPGIEPNALLEELVGRRVAIRRFELVEPSLEQVFIDRVGSQTAREQPAEEAVHV